MKHLLVSREYPPAPYPPGGIGTYVTNIARLLVERGEEVHILGQRWSGAPLKREVFHDGKLVVHRIGPNDLPQQSGTAERFIRERDGLKKTTYPETMVRMVGGISDRRPCRARRHRCHRRAGMGGAALLFPASANARAGPTAITALHRAAALADGVDLPFQRPHGRSARISADEADGDVLHPSGRRALVSEQLLRAPGRGSLQSRTGQREGHPPPQGPHGTDRTGLADLGERKHLLRWPSGAAQGYHRVGSSGHERRAAGRATSISISSVQTCGACRTLSSQNCHPPCDRGSASTDPNRPAR